MKQFSLEEYLKNPSRKVVTRDGRTVTRFLCTDLKNEFPIAAAVEKCEGAYQEDLLTYRNDGSFYNEATIDGRDLFFAPEKHEGWVNVYKAGNTPHSDTCIWTTEEEAKKWVNDDYVATVKIEWEE